ncbi:hypothetical protein EKL28_18735, partial [Staphylococcus aureus]
DIKITRNYTRYAEGSVLVEFGHTKVLCTASIDNAGLIYAYRPASIRSIT